MTRSSWLNLFTTDVEGGYGHFGGPIVPDSDVFEDLLRPFAVELYAWLWRRGWIEVD